MGHPLRLALAGVSGFGARHLAEIAKLQARGDAVLAACADPILAAASKRALSSLNLPPRCQIFESLETLLVKRSSFDALVLATPIHLHHAMLSQALMSGLPIYLEKPPVATMRQFQDIVEQPGHQQIAVAFQLIANPAVRALRQLILDGALGQVEVIAAAGSWPRGDRYYNRNNWAGRLQTDAGMPVRDGPATNGFAHLVHLATFLAGPAPDAFAVPRVASCTLLRSREMEASDSAFLHGLFPTGVRYQIAVTHCSRSEIPMEVRVQGSRGEARLTNDAARLFLNGRDVCRSGGHDEAITLAYEDFVRFASGRASRPATHFLDCLGFMVATADSEGVSPQVVRLPQEVLSSVLEEGDSRLVVKGIESVLECYLNGEVPSTVKLPHERPSAIRRATS